MREQAHVRRLTRFAYYAGALLLAHVVWDVYAWHWGTYFNFNRAIEYCEQSYCDFTMFYLEQAKIILTSKGQHGGFYYSPTFAIVLVPFTGLSAEDAVVAWTWVQALSLLLYVVAGVSLMRKLPVWTHAVFLLLTLTSYPILHNWKWGQANTLFVALSLSSLALAGRTHAAFTATPLALAASTRYFPAVYVLAFVQRKYWRVLTWFVAFSLVLLIVVPAVAMGPSAAWAFYRATAAASAEAAGTWVLSWISTQFMPSVLVRVLSSETFDAASLRPYFTVASYALALLNVAAAVLYRRTDHPDRTDDGLTSTRGDGDGEAMAWKFCFLAGCTPLLLPTSWSHYMVFLPFAQAFLLWRIVAADLPRVVRGLLVACVWLPGVVIASVFFMLRFPGPNDYSQAGYVLWSTLLMLALAHGLALLLPRRHLAPPPSARADERPAHEVSVDNQAQPAVE